MALIVGTGCARLYVFPLPPLTTDPQSPYQHSAGMVVIDAHGFPISGVEIEIINAKITDRTTSTADGTFKFTNLPKGNYSLVFRKSGFITTSIKIRIPSTINTIQLIHLKHEPGVTV